MKGLSAITLAVAVTLSATAFAAPKKSTSVASTSSTAGASSSSPALSSPTATATSAGSIGAALPSAPAKKWSMNLYTENYYGVRDANTSAGGAIANNSFVGVNYTLTDKYKAYIRQNFTGGIAADSKTDSKMNLADTELALKIANLAKWNGGSVAFANRLYLPTGRTSQATDQIARLRANVVISHEFGKHFEVGHLTDPRYTIHTQNEYTLDGKVSKTSDMKLVQYAYATAKANDVLSATVALGTIDSWERGSGDQTSQGYLDVAASAQLTKAIGLTIGIDSEPNIGHKQEKRFTFMRDTETEYYMNLMATM